MSPLAQRALLISGSCSAVACVLAGPLVLLAAIVCEWWATRPSRPLIVEVT